MSSSYEPHHRNAAGTGVSSRDSSAKRVAPKWPPSLSIVGRRLVAGPNIGQTDIDSAAFEPKGVDKSAGFIVEKGYRLSTLELRDTSLGVALQGNRLDS